MDGSGSLALDELLFSGGGLGDLCCLVLSFVTCELLFCALCAFGVRPRLKSQHVVWHPSAVIGTGRIDKAQGLRGPYVTSAAAAFLTSRAAGGRLDGREGEELVESLANSEYGLRVESVYRGMRDDKNVDG